MDKTDLYVFSSSKSESISLSQMRSLLARNVKQEDIDFRFQDIPRRSLMARTSDCTCRNCMAYPGWMSSLMPLISSRVESVVLRTALISSRVRSVVFRTALISSLI